MPNSRIVKPEKSITVCQRTSRDVRASSGPQIPHSKSFSPGTRDWLVERIASSSSRENEPSGSEVVADTMLVLAYVKICIVDHYSEANWHVGLILGYQRKKEILDELVSRVVRSGDDEE